MFFSTKFLQGSAFRIKKVVMSSTALVLATFASSSLAFTFPTYKVHAYSYYGSAAEDLTLNATHSLLSSLVHQEKAVYGASFSLSRLWTKYNSQWGELNNIHQITLGGELVYNFIKSTDYVEAGIKRRSNSFSLGAVGRYYINDAVFLRSAIGTNFTLTKSRVIKNSIKSLGKFFSDGNRASLGTYLNFGIGYDLETVTTNLSINYMSGRNGNPSYYTTVLGIGWNFSF